MDEEQHNQLDNPQMSKIKEHQISLPPDLPIRHHDHKKEKLQHPPGLLKEPPILIPPLVISPPWKMAERTTTS